LPNALKDSLPKWNPNPDVSSNPPIELLIANLVKLKEETSASNAPIRTAILALKTTSPFVLNASIPSFSSRKPVSPNAPEDTTKPRKEAADNALSAAMTATMKETADNVSPDSSSLKEPKLALLATSLSFL